MPKNVTIYLSNEIAEKMEKYPEVNWSEICRKAVVEYIDTRSQINITAILEKLKNESNEAYKQGLIFFYQLAPKMSLKEFDLLYPRVSVAILEGREGGLFNDEPSLSPEVAAYQAAKFMSFMIGGFCRKK